MGEFLQWPLGDEGERCLLGFSRVGYYPDGDRRLDGNILTFDLQKRICPDYWLFGTINYEHYADRLHSMPTYRFGAESFCDQWRFRGEAMSEFVVQNAETLRQNIWRQGTRWSARWQMNRRWDFLGAYSFWRYDDGNDLNEMKLRADYLFCFLPTQLKGVISIDGQTFREPTIFTSSDGLDVTGAIHPYFTPRGFVIYEGRLEWTHYFTRDHFLHSNNSWYSLQYGIAWDSEFVNYNLFRVLFNHDCGSWMSVGFDAHATIADIYKGDMVRRVSDPQTTASRLPASVRTVMPFHAMTVASFSFSTQFADAKVLRLDSQHRLEIFENGVSRSSSELNGRDERTAPT